MFKGGDSMIAISGSKVRSNFKEICDKVIEDIEAVIVTRTRGENVVLISEKEYNNIMENFKIFSNPERYQKIKNGILQYENGKASERKLIDD
jgi:antitoxin YefM